MTDGTPFTSKYPDYDDLDLVAECTDRDYRLAQTIRTPGFTRDGGTTQWAPDVKFSKTGYQPIKWLTDDSSKDTNVAAIASDVPLIRYAEVLLAYAEAKAELGEMSEEVWDKTIKPLRERAGVKSIYPTAADPYMVEYFQNQVTDPFILEVRRERGIELTMENSRYQDIIRWHQGELFARPWKGIWIAASETSIDLNGDGKLQYVMLMGEPQNDEAIARSQYSVETAEALGLAPYYLYRQKNTLQNLENVGWCKPGHEGLSLIHI